MQSSYPNYRLAVQSQMSFNENAAPSSDGKARITASYRIPQLTSPANIGAPIVGTTSLTNNVSPQSLSSAGSVFQPTKLPDYSAGRPLPSSVVGYPASMTALLEKLPSLIASTAARQPVYAQALAKNVYRPILTVGTPIVDQNQSYGRVYSNLNNSGGQSSSSSFNNQSSSSFNNQSSSSSSFNNQSVTANVVDGFKVPLNKYPILESTNYQRIVPSTDNYPPEAIWRPASTASSNFNPAKAFGVELATDDETDDDRTVDTPLPSRDALANAIASPASSLLDAKLLSQVSDAVARVEAHKAAARRQYLSSNQQTSPVIAPDTSLPAKTDSSKKDHKLEQPKQYQEADPSQVKQKFYELLRKYQKNKQTRPQQIVTEDDSNLNNVEHDGKSSDLSEDRGARRPALMGSRPRPSLLGSGDSWKPQEHSSLNDNYGREYKAYSNERKAETNEKSKSKNIDNKNPMILVTENEKRTKIDSEQQRKNHEIENFPCLLFGSLPVCRIDDLDLANVTSQFALNAHLNNCLPRKSPYRMEMSETDRRKCNGKHCKVFSQLKNLVALDQCYETCIWDYDPRFVIDYLPGTKRGVTHRYDFVCGESYLDDENKWKRYSNLLNTMMKQKVSAKINNEKVGPAYNKSDIVFVPKDSPQVKAFKMKMILENSLDIPSRMITEDFCEICNMAFTNIMSSMHHYDSAKHTNNVLSYGKSTAVEIILNTYPDFYLGYFNADWFVNCVRSTLKKCKQKPDQWMCDLCSIPLSGESHAQQHFLGTAHKKRAQDGMSFKEKMSKVAAAMRATETASQLERDDEEKEINSEKGEDAYDDYENDFNDEEEPYYDDRDYQEGNWGNNMDDDSYNRAYEDDADFTGDNVIHSGNSNYTKSPQKLGYQATFTTPRINKRGYDAAFR